MPRYVTAWSAVAWPIAWKPFDRIWANSPSLSRSVRQLHAMHGFHLCRFLFVRRVHKACNNGHSIEERCSTGDIRVNNAERGRSGKKRRMASRTWERDPLGHGGPSRTRTPDALTFASGSVLSVEPSYAAAGSNLCSVRTTMSQ
jgi:hypothetical protein